MLRKATQQQVRFIEMALGKSVCDLSEEIVQEGIAKRKHVVRQAASQVSNEQSCEVPLSAPPVTQTFPFDKLTSTTEANSRGSFRVLFDIFSPL